MYEVASDSHGDVNGSGQAENSFVNEDDEVASDSHGDKNDSGQAENSFVNQHLRHSHGSFEGGDGQLALQIRDKNVSYDGVVNSKRIKKEKENKKEKEHLCRLSMWQNFKSIC